MYKWEMYKWKDELKTDFVNKFRVLFQEFENRILQSNETSMHYVFFYGIFRKAGESMKVKRTKMKVNKQQPEWWDSECDRAKSNKFY